MLGNLTVTFRGPPGANASACSGAVPWPRLDSLLLLGVGPIDVASLRVQVQADTWHGPLSMARPCMESDSASSVVEFPLSVAALHASHRIM